MVTPAGVRQPLRRWSLSRLARDRSAVAAVEFALILPFMLTLYIGGVQVSEALSINRKVSHVADTVADLVTQSKSLTSSDISNIMAASAAVMSPYDASSLTISVAEIYIDSKGKATVAWSSAQNTSAPAPGSAVTLPAALLVPSSHLVAAVAHYPFTPPIGYVLTGSFDLSSTAYLQPRLSRCVLSPSYTVCQ
jgi:Flp pilus assembly protein TadG